MTRKHKHQAQCDNCKQPVFCKNCGAPITGATPFSLWLRNQPEIDSDIGFVATNIDYMWMNYKPYSGLWMLIEEKRYNAKCNYSQRQQFNVLHKACLGDPKYRGLHLLVFEKTTPDDGKIYLDGKQISKDTLIKFLKFEIMSFNI